MPCSFCRSAKHNISNCSDLAFQRAKSMYNDGEDVRPRNCNRNLDPYWFCNGPNNIIPSHPEWELRNINIYSTNLSHRRKPATQTALHKLNTILKLKEGSNSVDKEIGYIVDDDRVYGDSFYKIKINTENKVEIEKKPFNSEEGIRMWSEYVRIKRGLQEQRNNANREREIREREARHQLRLQEHNRLQQERIQERQRQHQERQRQQQISAQQEQDRLNQMVTREEAVEATECPICMDELKETNKMILRCGHQFCGDCIFKHFQGQGGCKCPQCRSEYALRVPNWQPPGQQQQARHARRAVPAAGGGQDREIINRMANMERMFMHFMDAFIPGEN